MSEPFKPEDASPSPVGDRAEHSAAAGAPGDHAVSGLEAGLTDAGMVLSKAVLGVARVILRQGRHRARKAAETGRARLDLRQLRRDRDAMYQKLGREVVHLVEGGEVAHPGLVRGVERIRELDGHIAEAEEELQLRQAAAEQAAAAQAEVEQGGGVPGASEAEDPQSGADPA